MTNDYCNKLMHGDCLEKMKEMPDSSADAIVTDPPAGISFMGKEWDHDKGSRDNWLKWMQSVAEECLRVIKPGGHALVWAIPRTSHWTGMAWELAGWIPRDKIYHCFGTGFPKSLNISKALDREAGAEREVTGICKNGSGASEIKLNNHGKHDTGIGYMDGSGKVFNITIPATDAAHQWEGWGTALKPAIEEWWLFRKPIGKGTTIAENVLKWGTGGLNIDGGRVGIDPEIDDQRLGGKGNWSTTKTAKNVYEGGYAGDRVTSSPLGRYPANLIHDGSPEVTELFDSGSASRFFYCAKSSKSEREAGLEEMPERKMGFSNGAQIHGEGYDKGQGIGLNRVISRHNFHPTVKPLALMRYLCRLITPPQGIVLDPFMGSGSTGVAAKMERFNFIGIEQDEVYCEIARRRLEETEKILQDDLFYSVMCD